MAKKEADRKGKDSQARLSISELEDGLRKRDLSPEQRAEAYRQIGQQYETLGEYTRARLNYEKAGDREAVAKSYETQGKPKQAARELYDHYYVNRTSEHQLTKDQIKERIGTLEKIKKLYEEAGVKPIFNSVLRPNAARLFEVNEQLYFFHEDLRVLEARHREQLEWEKLSPEEKKKRRKNADLEARSSASDDTFSMLMWSGGNPPSMIIMIVLGVLLLVLTSIPSFTGFAISNLSRGISGVAGAVLFLVGIAGLFLYSRRRKKK